MKKYLICSAAMILLAISIVAVYFAKPGDIVMQAASSDRQVSVLDAKASSTTTGNDGTLFSNSSKINSASSLPINKMDISSKTDTHIVAPNKKMNESRENIVYTVSFVDYDGKKLDTQEVEWGNSAVAPTMPKRDKYEFIGWDKSFSDVTANMEVTAQYGNPDTSLLELSDVEVAPGEKNVKIALSVKNNPGILGMVLTLTYDEKVMKLTSVSNGDAVSDVLTLTKAKVLKSGCTFVWDGLYIESDQVKDGDVLLLSFDILKDAAEGEYDVAVSYDEGNIVDNDLNSLTFSVKSGKVSVVK